MNKLFATSLVALSLAAALPAVQAQTADPAGAPASPSMHRHQDRAFKPGDRVEARLAYVRTALKITSAQQPQWDAYAGVMRKHAGVMEKRMQERRAMMEKGAGERAHPTLIERQERQRARLTTAVQFLDERLAVEKPLYAALSPEQQ